MESSQSNEYDVFISYPKSNKDVAEVVCDALESNGLRCWIAPRNITAGKEWGEAIIHAISTCRVMVLVFSSEANASPHVRREVERAVSRGSKIVPFRVEKVETSGTMEYYLSSTHWLDASVPPSERDLRQLLTAVRLALGDSDHDQEEIKVARLGATRMARCWAIVSLVIAGILILIGAIVVVTRPRKRGNEDAAAVERRVSVDSVQIRHLKGTSTNYQGDIGTTSFAARYADSVQVAVKLDDKASCYLVACNPDGSSQLCYPESETTPPPPVREFRFPADTASGYCLTDGIGFQAFVLVASRRPLPSYSEWMASIGQVPWESARGAGVWTFDGQRIERQDKDRGEIVALEVPKPIGNLCDFFKIRVDADAVFVTAFPVLAEKSEEAAIPNRPAEQ